jgi:alginate O-acetyltransferase complex protein AlgI
MPPQQQRTVPTPRLALAWAVLLGGLFGFWAARPAFDAPTWGLLSGVVLWATSKAATLICMPADDRRRLGWGRLVAYLFWPGMQPRHFLPERTPADAEVAPTVRGVLVDATAAALLIWAVPWLMPPTWPLWPRLLSGTAGCFLLVLFAAFDAWGLLYRACGVGVEKLWHNPPAATSLADFWGQRWNRIFSGMFRDVLFLPLARRVGATAALVAVFVYSGVLHENNSVAAGGGYGLPFLYFVIQGVLTWVEGRRPFRRVLLKGRPWLGWAWTASVVLGPLPLLFHEDFRERVLVPILSGMGVPGLPPHTSGGA